MRVDEKLVEENVENGWLSMADAVLVVVWGVGFRLPILCLGRRVHRHGVRRKLRFAKQEKEKINNQNTNKFSWTKMKQMPILISKSLQTCTRGEHYANCSPYHFLFVNCVFSTPSDMRKVERGGWSRWSGDRRAVDDGSEHTACRRDQITSPGSTSTCACVVYFQSSLHLPQPPHPFFHPPI